MKSASISPFASLSPSSPAEQSRPDLDLRVMTLYSRDFEYEMQLGWDEQRESLACDKEIDDKFYLWHGVVEKAIVQQKDVRLSIHMTEVRYRSLADFRSNSRLSAETPANFHFDFQPSFAKAPPRAVPLPEHCLCVYTKKLISERRFDGFAQLLRQFHAAVIVSEHRILVYTLVTEMLDREVPSPGLTIVLFSLIGAVEPCPAQGRVAASSSLLRLIDVPFVSELSAMRKHKEYFSDVMKGIGRCLLSNMSDLHENRPSTDALSIIKKHYAEQCLALLLPIPYDSSQLDYWAEIVPALSQKLVGTLVNEWVKSVLEFNDVFTILATFAENWTFAKERLEVVNSKLRDISHRKDLTLSDIKQVSVVLAENRPNFKAFIYHSVVPELVNKVLRVSKEPGSELIDYLLSPSFDLQLSKNLSVLQYYEKLISENHYSISMLATKVPLDERKLKHLLTFWIEDESRNGHFKGPKELLLKLDAEIATIHTAEIDSAGIDKAAAVAVLARKAASVFIRNVHSSGLDVLTEANLLSEVKTEAIKRLFNAKCARLWKLNKLDFTKVDTLVEQFPDNTGYKDLLIVSLELDGEITYENVEKELLENSKVLPRWKRHLYKSQKTQPSFHTLTVLIDQFATKVCERSLEIDKFISLKKSYDETFVVLVELVEVVCVQLDKATDAFALGLNKAVSSAIEYDATLRHLSTGLSSILSDSDKSALASQVQSLRSQFSKTALRDFEYPPDFAQLLEASKLLSTYQEYPSVAAYFHLQSVTLENLVKTCEKCKDSILSTKKDTVASVQSMQVSEVESQFKDEDWPCMIEVFKKMDDSGNTELEKLKQCLICLRSTPDFLTLCNDALKLKPEFDVDDQRAEENANNFLEQHDQHSALTIDSFLELYEFTESVVRPSVEGVDIDLALRIYHMFVNLSDLLAFLKTLSEEKIRFMLKHVEDYRKELSTKLIVELETVWMFFNHLKREKSYCGVLVDITRCLSKDKFRNISTEITNCNEKLAHLNTFLQEIIQPRRSKKEQIEAVVKNCVLMFTDQLGVRVRCREKVCYPEFSLETFGLLVRRAKIYLNLTHSTDNPTKAATSKQLLLFAHTLRECLSHIAEFQALSYPEDLLGTRSFSSTSGSFTELSDFSNSLKAFLADMQSTLRRCYEDNYLFSFYHGVSLWDNTFICKRDSQKDANDHLLSLNEILKHKSDPRPLLARVDFSVSFQRPSFEYVGRVVYHYIDESDILRSLLFLYMQTKKQLPAPDFVFQCSSYTTWGELQAFLYRCIKCSIVTELFTLIGCEQLSLQYQRDVCQLLDEICKKADRCGIAVVTNDEDCVVAKHVASFQDVVRVESKHAMALTEYAISSVCRQLGVTVVRSDSSGDGKTYRISRLSDKPATSVFVSGDFSLPDLCAFLEPRAATSTLLHISLAEVSNPALVDTALAVLVLNRSLRCQAYKVQFPTDCKVVIEVKSELPGIAVLKYAQREDVHFSMSDLVHTKTVRYVASQMLAMERDCVLMHSKAVLEMNRSSINEHIADYIVSKLKQKDGKVTYSLVMKTVSILRKLIEQYYSSAVSPEAMDFMKEDLTDEQRKKRNEDIAAARQVNVREGDTLIGTKVDRRKEILRALIDTALEVSLSSTQSEWSVEPEHLRTLLQQGQCSFPSWSRDNQLLLFFHGDMMPITVFSRLDPIPKFVNWLQVHPRSRNEEYNKEFFDFFRKGSNDLLDSLIASRTADISRSQDYVLTNDNFFKMLAISAHAAARQSVVILGETGCGKSALISYYVKEVLQQRLITVRIHHKITVSSLKAIVSNAKEQAESSPAATFWLFFDDCNTSECKLQIGDILTERALDGKRLPDNLVLIAACNFHEPIDGSSCRHRLNQSPLPASMLSFTMNFHRLPAQEYSKYLARIFEVKLASQHSAAAQLLTNLLVCAQSELSRELPMIGTLREITKVMRLFQWLVESVVKRKKLVSEERYQANCKHYELGADWASCSNEEEFAALLAFCYCFYYPLPSRAQRQHCLEMMEKVRQPTNPSYSVASALALNENDLAARMELPVGIALNPALKENIAILVPALCTRLPVILHGCPGSSKSTAISVVLSSLKGKKSLDRYLRTIAEAVVVEYQCTEATTASAFEKVFAKTEEYLSSAGLNLMPFAVLYDVGLVQPANLSAINQFAEMECRKVTFVATSTVALIVSLVDRTVSMWRSEPEKQELADSAVSMYRNAKRRDFHKVHEMLLRHTAEAFYEFTLKGNAGLFGLCDFYRVVNAIVAGLITEKLFKTERQAEIAHCIVRQHFSGQPGAVEFLMRLLVNLHPAFKEYCNLTAATPAIPKVLSSLRDPQASPVLLIASGEILQQAISAHIGAENYQQVRCYVGSRMHADAVAGPFACKLLSHLTLLMEKPVCVMLRDVDSIYSAMFSLLGRRLAGLDGRRFCVVSSADDIYSRCYVNPRFKVVCCVRQGDLRLRDPLFLSKFEKHRLELGELLSEQQRAAVAEVVSWHDSLLSLTSGREIALSRTVLFPLYSEECVKMRILTGEDVAVCKRNILKMASLDIRLLLSASEMHSELAPMQESIVAFFKHFLSESASRKSVAFVSSFEVIHTDSSMQKHSLYRHFSSIHSQEELFNDLEFFYSHKTADLYILDLVLKQDSVHIPMVKFSLENAEKHHNSATKKLCLLLRLLRNEDSTIEPCWFNDWSVHFFDSVTARNFPIDELPSLSYSTLIAKVFDIRKSIGKLTQIAYETIEKSNSGIASEETIREDIATIVTQIPHEPELVDAFRQTLTQLLTKRESCSTNLIERMFCDQNCVKEAGSIEEAALLAVENEILEVLPGLICWVERQYAMNSYFEVSDGAELAKEIWLSGFEKLNGEEIASQALAVNFKYRLKFPFSHREFKQCNRTFKSVIATSTCTRTAYLRFLREFQCRSFLQPYFRRFDSSLKQLFIRDFITISLTKRKSLLGFEEAIVELHNWLSVTAESLPEKVLFFFGFEELVCSVCAIFLLPHELGLNLYPVLKDILTSRNAHFELIDEGSSVPNIDDPDYPLLRSSRLLHEAFHYAQVKYAIGEMINIAVLHVIDHSERISRDVKELLQPIEDFLSAVTNFSEAYQIPVSSLKHFKEWTYVVKILTSLKVELGNVTEYRNQFRAAKVDNVMFPFTPEITEKLLNVSRQVSNSMTRSTKQMILRRHLQHFQLSYLELVVGGINEKDDLFWRYSGRLAHKILKICDCLSITDFTQIPPSESMRKLESVLSDSISPFNIICCDILETHFQTDINPTDLLSIKNYLCSNLSSFEDAMAILRELPLQFPKISRMFAVCNVKLYLKHYTYLRFCEDHHFDQSESEILKRIDVKMCDEHVEAVRNYVIAMFAKRRGESNSRNVLNLLNKKYFPVEWTCLYTFSETEDAEAQDTKIDAMQRIITETVSAKAAGDLGPLFTSKSVPDITKFHELLSKESQQSPHRMLGTFLEQKDKMQPLQVLHPLCDLLRILTEKFHHKYTRRDAEELRVIEALRIAGERDGHYIEAFHTFLQGWNDNCKCAMSFAQDVHFSDDDSLSEFLLKSKGSLLRLINLQNEVLASFRPGALLEVRLSELRPEQVCCVDFKTHRKYPFFYSKNPAFVKGEYTFDVFKVSDVLSKMAAKWTRVTWGDFPDFHYLFELYSANDFTLIPRIAELLGHQPLANPQRTVILELVSQSGFPTEQYEANLMDIFHSLQLLLLAVPTAPVTPSISLSDFAKSCMKRDTLNLFFTDAEPVAHLPLLSLISLYELIEAEVCRILLRNPQLSDSIRDDSEDFSNIATIDLDVKNCLLQAITKIIVRIAIPQLPCPDWIVELLLSEKLEKLPDDIMKQILVAIPEARIRSAGVLHQILEDALLKDSAPVQKQTNKYTRPRKKLNDGT